MLSYLKVEDFALIDSVEVEFAQGFNALTGETGAGKTVLVGAIGLLLGGRADSLQVRQGAERATLSCAFDLSGRADIAAVMTDAGYLMPGEIELLIGRTVSRQGKSRCTVNGRLAPVSALAEIGDLLVDVHGQNTHQALLKTGTHLEYLDRFAGKEQLARVEDYGAHYRLLGSLRRERESITAGLDGTAEHELLGSEIAEIDGAGASPGEIEELEREAVKLRNVTELAELGTRVRRLLAEEGSPASAREMLVEAQLAMERMSGHDPSLKPLAMRLEASAYEVEDLASAVTDYVGGLDTDPSRHQEVESRLSALRGLARKFGGSLESALAYRDDAVSRLAAMDAGGERLRVVDDEIASEQAEVERLAHALSGARREAAGALSGKVLEQLEDLELAGACFAVEVRASGSGRVDGVPSGIPGPSGSDTVEFLFSSEKGEQEMPLQRIASGGEMSRVMLALKMVLAGADRIPVLVFDEVDAGIGGETAGKVGHKLQRLTAHHQVFCVSHIPQIAAYADHQYRVFKDNDGGRASTGIEPLDADARLEEMCRMLGDSSGRKATTQHARDLLARAGGTRKHG